MATTRPPARLPLLGLTALTVGAAWVTALAVNWSALEVEEVPLVVVTTTSKVPCGRGGNTKDSDEAAWRVENGVATTWPPLSLRTTLVAPVKLLPSTISVSPPADVPEDSDRPLTEGAVPL